MRNETVLRILYLMQEGVVSPEEAADLIDALYEPSPTTASSATTTEEKKQNEERETARSLFDRIAQIAEETVRATGEAVRGIDWRAIGETIRNQTQRGLEEMRKALAELERGDWSLGRWGKHQAETTLKLDLALQPGQTLTVELPAGDIFVTGGFDGGQVEAEITLQGADLSTLQETLRSYSLLIEQTPEGARINAPELEGIDQFADLTLRVPKQLNLNLRTQRGEITIEKLDGMVQARTRHGDVNLRHLRGDITVSVDRGDLYGSDLQANQAQFSTVNGDLHLNNTRAENLTITLTHGDACLERVAVHNLKLETVRGDIEVELTEPVRGEVRLSTVSGDISLAIPDGSDCTLTMRTSAGNLLCDLECRDLRKGWGTLEGVCGEGTGTLSMEAVHGDLEITLRKHETS